MKTVRYKLTNLQHVPRLPADWKIARLDFVATVKARLGWKGLTADEYVNEGFIFLSTPNIKGEGEIDFENVNYITQERYVESPEIMVRVGDVLIAKDGSTLGITNVVRHLPAAATVNSSIAVIRPRDSQTIDSHFLFRWLSSTVIQGTINKMKDGQGVPHLFQADIKKFAVVLPPKAVQIKIADFLDHKTAAIDALVAKKRALIEKLKEKRSALISRTVTRGLPPEAARAAGFEPNPEMKQSGIEWLGDVPQHWRHKRLKYVCRFVGGGTPNTDKPEFWNGDIPWVSPKDMKSFEIVDTADHITELGLRASATQLISPGTVLLVVRSGILRHSIPVAMNRVPVTLNQDMRALITSTEIVPRYLARFIEGNQQELLNEWSKEGATVESLESDWVANTELHLPSKVEQHAIADFLDRETAKIDSLVAKIEQAIERLQEYRTALITAAVTGKIDVRQEQSSPASRGVHA